jgi:hypothetical protein
MISAITIFSSQMGRSFYFYRYLTAEIQKARNARRMARCTRAFATYPNALLSAVQHTAMVGANRKAKRFDGGARKHCSLA